MSTKHLKTWCLVHWDCAFFQERSLQTESPKKNLVKVEFIIEMMRTTLLDTRSGDTEIKYIKIRYSENPESTELQKYMTETHHRTWGLIPGTVAPVSEFQGFRLDRSKQNHKNPRNCFGASEWNPHCDERQQKHTYAHTPSGDIMRWSETQEVDCRGLWALNIRKNVMFGSAKSIHTMSHHHRQH